ncbi:hypothetical protein [Paraburkholderia fungorum]|jgi:hypothetical protein|uniref:hypothetical protein n=1 Tax=Paraburkholderia fungorum TaxID=134537 RepID=UPI00351E302B
MKTTILQYLMLTTIGLSSYTGADEPQRQSEIAQRSAEVMPFSLSATTHIFRKTSDGGTQCVFHTKRTAIPGQSES